MRRQLVTGLLATVALVVLLGLAYPLAMTGLGQALFSRQANGSLVKVGGQVVGSALIGQAFDDAKGNPLPQYFQPRPSAAGKGYDATSSGATNLGPSNPDLLNAVAQRVSDYRRFNGLAPGAAVPVDAVTSSGSGLDPDISEANALDQAPRVAAARHLQVASVVALVHQHANGRPWGVLGEGTVNVLDLNVALDRMG
ncbi:MAG TPA: K(+)-transporting ATPase subunit C [Acidimicrobiales bacterium]|nr:K(+)-transporting ATPase subunit C [Acidimicrobiales bacterium]